LLALRGVPALDDAVAEIRTWRRDRLTTMLRHLDDEGGLAVDLPEAVALAFALTAQATWHSLAVQSGLGTAAAQRLATRALATTVLATAPTGNAKSSRPGRTKASTPRGQR
jgi:hypothetical protein